jgi:hypothetical protein
LPAPALSDSAGRRVHAGARDTARHTTLILLAPGIVQ